MAIPNVFAPRFDKPREHPGLACRRARVGRPAGAQRLGASVCEVPPRQAAYPHPVGYYEGEEAPT